MWWHHTPPPPFFREIAAGLPDRSVRRLVAAVTRGLGVLAVVRLGCMRLATGCRGFLAPGISRSSRRRLRLACRDHRVEVSDVFAGGLQGPRAVIVRRVRVLVPTDDP